MEEERDGEGSGGQREVGRRPVAGGVLVASPGPLPRDRQEGDADEGDDGAADDGRKEADQPAEGGSQEEADGPGDEGAAEHEGQGVLSPGHGSGEDRGHDGERDTIGDGQPRPHTPVAEGLGDGGQARDDQGRSQQGGELRRCQAERVLIVAISLGIGVIPMASPDFYHAFPESVRIVLDSGISTGCVVAVLLNLSFNHLGRGTRTAPTSTALTGHGATPEPAPARTTHAH